MFIYVVKGDGPLRKVGRAVDPARRLGAMQTASASKLKIVHQLAVPSEIGSAVERFAHWLLRDSRRSGEWFQISDTQAIRAVNEALASVQSGKRPARTTGGFVGRPPLNVKPTMVRLAESVRLRIIALVGPNRMAEFIRDAVERELTRREKAHNSRPKEPNP